MFIFMSVGQDNVSELQPPAGLFFISQVMYKYGGPQWNDTDGGKPKDSEKNLLQCHSVHHKSHMD
jgi:hypothetical protein